MVFLEIGFLYIHLSWLLARVRWMFQATSVYLKVAVHFLHHEYVFLAVLIIDVIS